MTFETTWYVNERPVAEMHPYSAYDVTSNKWLVSPNPAPPNEHRPVWDVLIQQDLDVAREIIDTYNQAFEQVEGTVNPGPRLNAEITLRTAAAKGAMLFDSIHEGRKKAFSPSGVGFESFDEYRYKSAKGNGVMPALREMKQELIDAGLDEDYGVLPDARETLVRAAMARRYAQ